MIADGLPVATTLTYPSLHRSHDGPVNSVSFSPDGQTVLTGSRDGTARLWDALASKPLCDPLHHDAPMNSVSCSQEEQTVLTARNDSTVRLSDSTAVTLHTKPH